MYRFVQLMTRRPVAEAVIKGDNEHPLLRGNAKFYMTGCGTLVVMELNGLPADEPFIAAHIHNGSDCEDSGTHLDFENTEHPMHTGDFPSLLNNNGYAWLAFFTKRFTPCRIIGYPVIIHAHREDFKSQPSGDPGAKIGCGIIKSLRN